jgi:hypothetical protein
MTHRYNIKLIPEDGATVENDTKREYDLGYTFKVVTSDAPCFRKGSRVTEMDIATQEEHHDSKYTVKFQTVSLFQEIEQLADTDYGWSQAHKLLVSGKVTL